MMFVHWKVLLLKQVETELLTEWRLKTKEIAGTIKLMVTIYWDCRGILMIDFMERIAQ